MTSQRLDWLLLQLRGDDSAGQPKPLEDDQDALAPDDPPSEPPDPEGYHLRVRPPRKADEEIVALKKDLSDAPELLRSAVQNGYAVHGPSYFESIRDALNAPLANEYQGSEKPLRQLSQPQLVELSDTLQRSIDDERRRITDALTVVEAMAVTQGLNRLANSRAQIINSTTRYVQQANSETLASAWLDQADSGPAALAFTVTEEDGVDLVKSLFTVRTYHRELAKRDVALARASKEAGPEMQRIVAQRWKYLRAKDPRNTPPSTKTLWSDDYGVHLLDASNSARPDLVADALRRFPDPAGVTRAKADVINAAAAFTATVVDEGAAHPILYRIWSPALADELYAAFNRPGIGVASAKIFSPLVSFRTAISEALRSAYAAASSLSDRINNNHPVVWEYPLLIGMAVEALDLAEDDYERIAAEHRLEELAEQSESTQHILTRASEVLMAAELAIRFAPAPQVTLPATVALGVLDAVVGGLSLLSQFFQESATREGFRAFLIPGDSFAASDGSYLGTMIGAAFLLFGIAGLRRTTVLPPTKAEVAIVGGGIAAQEYMTLNPPKQEP